jgi:2-polyprenyl-3-methyl-5-hydroxy-6-metoxy-1,4-benzoquinol methylase
MTSDKEIRISIHQKTSHYEIQADHEGFFQDEQGIFVPNNPISHRDYEYDQNDFDFLLKMQREHFWYRGRHRFLLNAVNKNLSRRADEASDLHGIDMGGGCGGWLEYLHGHDPSRFQELALADSSHLALSLAEPIVGAFAARYEIDLLDLTWDSRWDVVFLLDVIEHIPEHLEVIKQVRKSLKPGGLLFVTAPALQFFWSYNDVFARHQRRYSLNDFSALAHDADMKCLQLDYFMFFLSPALYLSRLFARPPRYGSEQQVAEYLAKTHARPPQVINALLESLFSLETTLSNLISFPWGTSILGVFQK